MPQTHVASVAPKHSNLSGCDCAIDGLDAHAGDSRGPSALHPNVRRARLRREWIDERDRRNLPTAAVETEVCAGRGHSGMAAKRAKCCFAVSFRTFSPSRLCEAFTHGRDSPSNPAAPSRPTSGISSPNATRK